MKSSTKRNIVITGAALAGVYLISQSMGGEQAGGFGGGGGAPLLPGDVGDTPVGDTINYIMGGEPVGDPFGGFSEEEVKKTAIVSTLDPSFGTTLSTVSTTDPILKGSSVDLSPTAWRGYIPPKDSKKQTTTSSEKSEGRPWWNPFSWNLGDAIENYGAYSDKTWGRTPEAEKTFFGGGKSGGEGFGGSWGDPVKKQNIVNASKKIAAQSTSHSRGYSRMVGGATHSPGWQQMGYRSFNPCWVF